MFISRALAVITSAAMLMSAFAFTASADARNGFTDKEIASSEIKPSVTIDKKEITLSEAKDKRVFEININLSGADQKYAAAAFHIFWDEHLTAVRGDDGLIVTAGDAVKGMLTDQEECGNGVVVSSTAAYDTGRDGVMYTLRFTVPADAGYADKYPVWIQYEENGNSGDLFTNYKNDETGRLMQAWTFTEGLTSGGIYVETTTTTTTTTTTAPPPMIGDIDKNDKVTATDASLILVMYADIANGKREITKDDMYVCDVNRNSKIEAGDASTVLCYYALVSGGSEMLLDDYLRDRGIKL